MVTVMQHFHKLAYASISCMLINVWIVALYKFYIILIGICLLLLTHHTQVFCCYDLWFAGMHV